MMMNRLRQQFKKWQHAGQYSSLVGPAAFVYRHARETPALLHRRAIMREIEETRDVRDPQGLIEMVFHRFHESLRPYQRPAEMRRLLERVAERAPKTIVEIGTARGGTLLPWCRLGAASATIISIDLPGGLFGGGYPLWKVPIYRRFEGSRQKLHLLRGDSHEQSMLDDVIRRLRGKPIDLLFIDGDHTRQGVERDYEMYGPHVADDGMIVFHDIVDHPDPSCGVPEFWQQMREKGRRSGNRDHRVDAATRMWNRHHRPRRMTVAFDHFVLTRFNVRQTAESPGIGCDPAWLEPRFALFERFCLPSMHGQTADFRWLIFFDEATPREYLARIDELSTREHMRIVPLLLNSADADAVRRAIARQHAGSTRPIITTRLDNDDALAIDHIERVQTAARRLLASDPTSRHVIYHEFGHAWHRGHLYRVRDDRNAFASMVEPAPLAGALPTTVWARQHRKLGEVAPVVRLDGHPGWLQVIHDANLRNRLRGRRVDASVGHERYSIDSANFRDDDGPAGRLFDRVVASQMRLARERLIDAVRVVRDAA